MPCKVFRALKHALYSVADETIGKTMKKLGIILFGLLLLAQPVQAQDLAPKIADGATVTYTYNGPEAYYGGWGVIVGPYKGTLLTPTNANMTLYCVDFYRRVMTGTITAEALSLSNPGNFPVSQRWGSTTTYSPVALANFQQAAYLASMFHQFTGQPGQAAAWRAIHGAIWTLVSGVPATISTDPDVMTYLAMANAGYQSYGDYHDWRLLKTTAVNGNEFGTSQHFLVQTVSPEPQTYVLLGSGLLFLVFVGRRRLKENGYS
ncbi:MAG: hypothetical protein HKO65_03935 [Gemmatimonadetes bacterium]|nr:hypothetical protein [Gemmatimonadota bacterium]NNM04230.1 hypothetical protein [Gemmatimonadota bacterium]